MTISRVILLGISVGIVVSLILYFFHWDVNEIIYAGFLTGFMTMCIMSLFGILDNWL